MSVSTCTTHDEKQTPAFLTTASEQVSDETQAIEQQ
jgi:hypothetical protein